jgi:L-lysine epsilon oxidase-like protein
MSKSSPQAGNRGKGRRSGRSLAWRAVMDDRIVSAAIYPPMGVCRVGNSQDEFFIGPEVPDPLPQQPGFYRDATGALKRQAARFRIYGLNANGDPVRELTANEATITWRVHLVNQKSAWYQFQLALDIPEAASAHLSALRNASIADRQRLVIDPGLSAISGVNQSGAPLSGQFMGIAVYLGELRTDDAGRLIVLGGHGVSASYDGSAAVTFANNDRWYDDTSDGPVTAEVEFEGTVLSVQPAWVITAPPDYAPMQKSVRTMWDLMRDTAIKAGFLSPPPLPSFRQDILPIFERLTNLQWVNAGFAATFGLGGPFNFTTSEWVRKLSDPTPAYRPLRKNIANQFRQFGRDSWSPVPLPWLYGDAMNIPPAKSPRQHASLTDTQMRFLQQWSAGEFIADYDPEYQPPRDIDQVPAEQQPDLLTRAAMEFCLADAFHPGCEMPWPMRAPGMYTAPFRLKHAPPNSAEPSYGMYLTSDETNASSGPVNRGQVPGGITRWMALPWQTDAASCRSGYDRTYDPYLPTFWPARVPNQVMSEADYDIVMDTNQELGQRLQAFANRADWFAPLGQGYVHQLNHMIHHFAEMGVVEVRQGVPDDPNFPPTMQVQDYRPAAAEEPQQGAVFHGAGEDRIETMDEFDLTQIEKVHRFQPGTTLL